MQNKVNKQNIELNLEKHNEKNTKRKKGNLQMLAYRQELSDVIQLTNSSNIRISNCGIYMQFLYDNNFENKKLIKNNSCGNRFCPICSKTKAIKDSIALKIMTKYIDTLGRAYIFLTLTAPNCQGSELSQEINRYNNAFKYMITKRKEFSFIKGFVRKLEVTYNSKSNTYHPHLHVLISVLPSYFNNDYMPRDTWLKHWQEVMHDDSITQVDIRRVKPNDKSVNGHIYELTKYIAKDSNYLYSLDVFKAFYEGLKGKRMYGYGGDFKVAKKMLQEGKLKEYYDVSDVDWIYLVNSVWGNNIYDNEIINLKDLGIDVNQLLANNDMSISHIINNFINDI